MSYRLVQFDTVTLPGAAYHLNATIGTRSRILPTIGGFYDSNGAERARLALPYQLTFAVTALEAAGVSALGATLDSLRALVGQRLRLWATPMDATKASRWAWARLGALAYDHAYMHRVHQPLTMSFEVLSAWNGSGHTGAWDLDSGYFFDNGLFFDSSGVTILNPSPGGTSTLVVTNGGNYPVDNAGITVTCGPTAAITALTIGITSVCQFTYSGTIATSQSLVIDCGAFTVANNGVADAANFALTANQTIPAWLRLAAGSNTLNIAQTGGSTDSTIGVTFSDGWL